MKLVTLNCSIFDDNNEKVANFLKELDADIVCLQEVTRPLESSVEEIYKSKLIIDNEILTNYVSSFFGTSWISDNFNKLDIIIKKFGGFIEYGLYFLSKQKISGAKNVFVENQLTYVTDWSTWPGQDYRSVQVVDIVTNNSPLRILNYHGVWSRDKKGNNKTLWACEMINNLAQEVDYPVIICGDFNLFPDSESMQVLNMNFKSLVDEYKIKSTRPEDNELSDKKRNVVDYVFISEGIKVNNFEVLNNDVSDHLPLILDFEVTK